jgi:hypothetical protein
MTITKSLTGKELSAINRLCKRIFCILQLKSRPGGWLKQFVCDTVLMYCSTLRSGSRHITLSNAK